MGIDNLLAAYKKLTDMTEKMLGMVEDEEWDALISLKSEYEQKVKQLTTIQQKQDVIADFNAERYPVIQVELMKVLANNAQLKARVNKQCEHLSGLISETVSQRSQINTYHQVASMRS